MTLLSELVPRALPASNISTAAVFRAVVAYHPTMLIDEADSFLNEREELRGILNSGHSRRQAHVVRCDGDNNEPRTFSTWCPKVVALIGKLPDTLADRSINISMRRQGRGERAERIRLDRLDLKDLRRKAARWAEDHGNNLRSADADVPDSLGDRAADNWRFLLAIADTANGDWPEKARRAADVLSGGQRDDGDAETMLLEDLKKIFEERGASRLGSADIVQTLVAMAERPWPEWRQGHHLTQRGLARLLAPFGVKPRLRRIAGEAKAKRAYDRQDLEDPWTRYLDPGEDIPPEPPVSSVTHVTTQAGPTFQPDSQVLPSEECNTLQRAGNPLPDYEVTDVTVGDAPSGGESEFSPETDEDGWTEA